jgi:hypothetical protein
MHSIAAVSAVHDQSQMATTFEALRASSAVRSVALAAPAQLKAAPAAFHRLRSESLNSAAAVIEVLRWFESTDAEFLLWFLSPRVELTAGGLARLAQTATDTRAAIVYSDYFDRQVDAGPQLRSLVDYQSGSIRDDFDFGHLVMLSRPAVKDLGAAIESDGFAGDFGGWYDLRLRTSERGPVVRLPEPTYVVRAQKARDNEEEHFRYVDPRNRNYQIEMERIATAHLKRIGAWLPPPKAPVDDDGATFPVECSVIIPVRNRVRTVGDAVASALSQKTDFAFNVIVVDNHSTDGTTDVLRDLAAKSDRLVHLIPTRDDLGIGGCWDEAINSPKCGRYAVQLDSDDLYSSPDVLARIRGEFARGQVAAVIGSYTIVDFNLKQIPPGLIDHREWSDENGHNNALRIHGLGAPRAFHVPTLRKIGFPNVIWGEDYAVMLQLTRQFACGRIYDSLYWCRRWEGNSDHELPIETKNRYATYKDRLRSIEIAARQQMAKR